MTKETESGYQMIYQKRLLNGPLMASCSYVLRLFLSMLLLLICSWEYAHAQQDMNIKYQGDFGMELGSSSYFGDLNPEARFRGQRYNAGLIYSYFLNDYISASAMLHYGQLGYADSLNSNPYWKQRNLSFQTSIWDFSLGLDYDFLKIIPGSTTNRWTPFLSTGLGIMHFNPFTYLNGRKYYLQPLGTEGQGSPQYPNRHKYPLWTMELPVGFGIKYNINRSFNVSVQGTYHFTGTDYLDDVSTTYAGSTAFPGNASVANQLQDRSHLPGGATMGVAGRQRGNAANKDQFLYLDLRVTFLISNYRCPSL